MLNYFGVYKWDATMTNSDCIDTCTVQENVAFSYPKYVSLFHFFARSTPIKMSIIEGD